MDKYKYGFLFLALLILTYATIHYWINIAPRRRAIARCIQIYLKIREASLEGYAEIPHDFAELIRLVKEYEIKPFEIDLHFNFISFAAQTQDIFGKYVRKQAKTYGTGFGESRRAFDNLMDVHRVFIGDLIQPILDGVMVFYT